MAPRSNTSASIVSLSPRIRRRASLSRRTRRGASAIITAVSLIPPWTSGAALFSVQRSNGWMTQALSAASWAKSRTRFSSTPRLPPWPLTMTRLRAGSERTSSRVRSRTTAMKFSSVRQSVPGAQSCSRDRLIETVGSCHRSNASPHRAMIRRVSSSAMTTSVLSGRCGPCCSIAPTGNSRIELSFRCCETSGKVRSPIDRLGGRAIAEVPALSR